MHVCMQDGHLLLLPCVIVCVCTTLLFFDFQFSWLGLGYLQGPSFRKKFVVLLDKNVCKIQKSKKLRPLSKSVSQRVKWLGLFVHIIYQYYEFIIENWKLGSPYLYLSHYHCWQLTAVDSRQSRQFCHSFLVLDLWWAPIMPIIVLEDTVWRSTIDRQKRKRTVGSSSSSSSTSIFYILFM